MRKLKPKPNKPYDNAAKALKALRAKNQLTQRELAAILQCNAQMLSNAERGLCFLPLPELRLLAHIDRTRTLKYLNAYVDDKYETARQKINKVITKL